MNKFQGFEIGENENGFYWQEGGYFETRQECEADIADWNAGTYRYETPLDTPSLPPAWYEHR